MVLRASGSVSGSLAGVLVPSNHTGREGWLAGAGSYCLMGTELSVCSDLSILEVDSGGGCATL